jgi:RNA polymerase sigma-70 factor (ECF subfamily)
MGAGVRDAVAAPASAEELALVERLRAGDERAFTEIVRSYHPLMLRVASSYVSGRANAEEVVQEAWVGVLNGLSRFEGRSTLKTWILRIVVNKAITRGKKEARSVPFSALAPEEETGAAVEPERFLPAEGPFPGHWRSYPQRWDSLPEGALVAGETLGVIRAAVAELPPLQRTVITLRDIEGCDAAEVCETLGISDANQRVLLHRARSRVRRALESYLDA